MIVVLPKVHLIFAYMSFVLLSCITPNEIIRVKATYCYFQPPRKQRIALTDQSVVRNVWVGR